MSGSYAFQPFGLSRAVTVGGAAPVTISLSVVGVVQTDTLAVTNGFYIPKCVRLSNEGTASVFVNFAETAAKISVSPTIGMRLLANTDVIFKHGGQNFVAFVCASTFTTTLSMTLGEGMH